jgi:hypothetical protein
LLDITVLTKKYSFISAPKTVDVERFQQFIFDNYSLTLPPSYWQFMRHFGPGTLGGFLHMLLPGHLQTHRERLEPFMDEELEALLVDTGDILVFATTNNRDMCGWQLADLKRMEEAPIICVDGFEAQVMASSVLELVDLLASGKDVFGIGALPNTFAPDLQVY